MKTKSISSLLFILTLFIASCSKDDPSNPTPVTPSNGVKGSAKDITGFSISSLSPAVAGTIDAVGKTITAAVPGGTDLTKLVPTITVSDKATVSPATGAIQDFSKPVTYTVKAEDGSSQAYIVTVTAGASVCHVVSEARTYASGTGMVTYELDAQNRLIKMINVTYDYLGAVNNTATTAYTYDQGGFRAEENTSYVYVNNGKDNLKGQTVKNSFKDGRLARTVSATTYVDPAKAGVSFSSQYEYDSQGQIVKNIFNYNNGNDQITTSANGLVTSVTQTGNTYELNAQGFVTKITSSNGSATVYKYDSNGLRVLSESYNTQGLKTSYYTYEYGTTKYTTPTNPLGSKGFPTDAPSAYGKSGFPQTKSAYYSVDAGGKATFGFGNAYSYEADANGNLTSITNLSTSSYSNPYTTKTSYKYEGCK